MARCGGISGKLTTVSRSFTPSCVCCNNRLCPHLSGSRNAPRDDLEVSPAFPCVTHPTPRADTRGLADFRQWPPRLNLGGSAVSFPHRTVPALPPQFPFHLHGSSHKGVFLSQKFTPAPEATSPLYQSQRDGCALAVVFLQLQPFTGRPAPQYPFKTLGVLPHREFLNIVHKTPCSPPGGRCFSSFSPSPCSVSLIS